PSTPLFRSEPRGRQGQVRLGVQRHQHHDRDGQEHEGVDQDDHGAEQEGGSLDLQEAPHPCSALSTRVSTLLPISATMSTVTSRTKDITEARGQLRKNRSCW